MSAPAPSTRTGVRGLIERVVLREDTATPLVGPALAAVLDRCANMRMYVARPV